MVAQVKGYVWIRQGRLAAAGGDGEGGKGGGGGGGYYLDGCEEDFLFFFFFPAGGRNLVIGEVTPHNFLPLCTSYIGYSTPPY